ncbi:hypothetical protein RIF29_17326 [Crotalaria pallida]|uniref:Uncharacterized protein n=1 Tax=Crotalaria pallida TaxID=3830 RepID=A0AAN9IKC8_CROPI
MCLGNTDGGLQGSLQSLLNLLSMDLSVLAHDEEATVEVSALLNNILTNHDDDDLPPLLKDILLELPLFFGENLSFYLANAQVIADYNALERSWCKTYKKAKATKKELAWTIKYLFTGHVEDRSLRPRPSTGNHSSRKRQLESLERKLDECIEEVRDISDSLKASKPEYEVAKLENQEILTQFSYLRNALTRTCGWNLRFLSFKD